MLKAEVDFDLGVLQLAVQVSQVVLDVLPGQLNVVQVGRLAHDTLVPHRHAVERRRRGRELTHERCKDRVRVPVHDRRQVNVHVENEGKRVFLEVAVKQELVHFLKLKLDRVGGQPDRLVSQTHIVAEADSDVIDEATDAEYDHHVVEDVVEATTPAVERRH